MMPQLAMDLSSTPQEPKSTTFSTPKAKKSSIIPAQADAPTAAGPTGS